MSFSSKVFDLIVMQLLLGPVFFTFSLGTKIHYYGRTILHGGAKYRATSCGFVVVQHEKFAENYRMYSKSHFVKALELVLLLCYMIYGKAAEDTVSLLVMGSIWFLVGSWLFAPFIFNPAGYEWQKIDEDWDDWDKWMSRRGGPAVPANRSWESWWEEEQEYLLDSGISGKLCELLLSCRFLIYRYGILSLTGLMGKQHSIVQYGQSWLVIVVVMIVMKIKSMRRRSSWEFLYIFRLLEFFMFVGMVFVVMLFLFLKEAELYDFSYPTVGDILQCLLAFLPTGWALIQISQVVGRQPMEAVGMWDAVKELAGWYEYIMSLVILIPITVLAFFVPDKDSL